VDQVRVLFAVRVLLAWARRRSSSFGEDSRVQPRYRRRRPFPRDREDEAMLNAQVWVHDQDEALAFYTEELKSRGVEFQQEPTEQPYGIDAGFRDPSGNQMRIGPA
jgi:hypothetical protein